MLAHELDFLKGCREMRGSQESVRFSVNYPTQSTASSIAALTGYELMQMSRQRGWDVFIPGFIHDCLEGDFGHRHWVDVFDELPRFAEEWPYEQFNLPISLDIEVGVRGGPALVEFKRAGEDRRFVRDGVMTAKFKGNKEYMEQLVARLRAEDYYDVELTDLKESMSYTSWKDMYMKVASSVNLSFGQKTPTLAGKIRVECKHAQTA